jgi:hypothetical protein
MTEYTKTCTFQEYLSLLLQVMFALDQAREVCDFLHGDFHNENVLIRDLPKGMSGDRVYIRYYDTYVRAKKVATIIDYGSSHIKVGNINVGKYSHEDIGMLPDRSYPLSDIYKFMTSSLKFIREHNPSLYSNAKVLLEAITSETADETLDQLEETGSILPVMNGLDKFTHRDYINIIMATLPRKLLEEVVVRSIPRGAMVMQYNSDSFPPLRVDPRSCLWRRSGPYHISITNVFELRHVIKSNEHVRMCRCAYNDILEDAVLSYNDEIRRLPSKTGIEPPNIRNAPEATRGPTKTTHTLMYIGTLQRISESFEKFIALYDAVAKIVRIHNAINDVAWMFSSTTPQTAIPRSLHSLIREINNVLSRWKNQGKVWREQFFDLLFAAQDADEEFDEEMFIWYDIGLALLMYISPIASE